MKTIVTVRLTNGDERRVALLGGNDMASATRKHGEFKYGFDPKLVPLLRDSTIFAKLETEVMHAFSTKYALALYEVIARRVRLKHRFYEIFELAAFREALGVPSGKLTTWGNFNLRAITPALIEVNALAPFGVKVEPETQGRKVVGVKVF